MDISKMTIEQRIEEFWNRHSIVDTSLVPDVWLTWTGKRDKKEYRKYYQLSTGLLTEERLPWIRYDANGQRPLPARQRTASADRVCLRRT